MRRTAMRAGLAVSTLAGASRLLTSCGSPGAKTRLRPSRQFLIHEAAQRLDGDCRISGPGLF